MANSKDIRSKFRLEFEAPGAEATKKKIDKITQALSPAKMATGLEVLSKITHRNLRQMAALQKQVQGLATTFKGLEKIVDRIGKAMDKIEGGGGRGGGKRGGAGGGGPGGSKAQRPDASFSRGFLQGTGLGDYFPQKRLPGQMRQAAGNITGQAVRGAASRGAQIFGGIRSMPFTGLQGMQTAAMGIPIVGGALAGALGQGQAAATKHLDFQRSMLALAPHLRFGGGGMTKGRKASPQEFAFNQLQFPATPNGPTEPRFNHKTGKVEMQPIYTKSRLSSADLKQADEQAIATARPLPRDKGEAPHRIRGRASGMQELAKAGRNLGAMDMTQTNQFASQFMGRSGGGLDEALKQHTIQRGIAAQTLFGVGGETTGAFGKAARRGGIVGGQGNGGQALEDAIKAGMSAGMDQTEVRDFLEEIAGAQQRFMTTGIPVNPKSLAMLQGTAAGTGLGVGRGMAVGSAFANRAQQISQNGPETATDFLMLQKFTNFKGGSLEDLEDAMEKMENLQDLKPEQFLDFIRSLSQGAGGGTAGRFSSRSALKGIGAPIGIKESKTLDAVLSGNASPEQMAQVAAIQQQVAQGARKAQGFTSEGAAAGVVDDSASGVKRQAGIENTLIGAGGGLLKTMQDLEESQAQVVTGLSNLAPTLSALSEGALETAKKVPAIAQSLEDLIELAKRFLGGHRDPNIPGVGKN